MDCKTKSNILVDAQVGNPKATASDIYKGTLTADQVTNHLMNPLHIVEEDNIEEIQQAREDKAKALNKIAGFREFGLIVNDSDPVLSEAGTRVFDNIITNKDEAIDFVNTLNGKKFRGGAPFINLYKSEGTVQSNIEPNVLNDSVINYLSTRIPTAKTYISGSKDNIKISPKLALDYNTFLYSRYLNTIGDLAEIAKRNNTESDQDAESISQLRSKPIVELMEAQRDALHTENIRMDKGEIPYDYKKIQVNKRVLDELKASIEQLGKDAELQDVVDFFTDQLNHITSTLDNNVGEYDENVLWSFWRIIKLIKNTSNRDDDYKFNPIVTEAEAKKDPIIQATLDGFLVTANSLESRVMDEMVHYAMKAANERLGTEWNEKEIRTVKGLETGLRRRLQAVLGLHHIDAPLVTYVKTVIDTVSTISFYSASEAAKEIRDLYEAQENTLPDGDNTYRQKNAEGRDNGFLTHLFSASWFDDAYKIGNYEKLANQRRASTIAFDPWLLFEGDKLTDKEREKKVILQNEIRETLGEDDYQDYIKIAESKYNFFKAAKAATEEEINNNPDKTKGEKVRAIYKWNMENSPIERVKYQYKKYVDNKPGMPSFKKLLPSGRVKNINPTTEKFLLRIPRRTTKSGVDTGYYDPSYTEIRKSPVASKFYDAAVKAYRLEETARGVFAPEKQRVALAYMGKSISELMADKDYEGAIELQKRAFMEKFWNAETFELRELDTDFSGDPQLQLHEEVHSIPQELNRRTYPKLEADARYQTLSKVHPTAQVRNEMRKIRRKYMDESYREIEAELSDDLLQSVVMAVHSRHTFLEKRTAETAINIAKAVLLNKGIVQGRNTDASQSAMKTLEDHLNHYITIAFYDGKDEDVTTPIFGEIEDDEKRKRKGIGSRRIAAIVRNLSRVAILGWSPLHAVLNVGQQFFSNFVKAAEGDAFGYKEFTNAVFKEAGKKSSFELIDKLYIVGDVAFSYKKRSIYERNQFFTNLINPMYVHTQAEKFNQGSTAIATMMKIRLNEHDSEGNIIGTKSMFDALEDGSLPENFSHEKYKDRGEKLLIKLTVDKVRPIVMRTAGDYLSPLMIEKGELGKLAMMFRKWLPEMLMDRLHGRKYDYALDKYTEGRLYGLYKAAAGLIKNRNMAALKGDEVRYRAARAGLAEVMLAIALNGLMMALGTLYCNTPQCKEKHPAALLLINILGRLTGDVTQLAFPPSVIMQVGTNPFAATSWLTDVGSMLINFSEAVLPFGSDGRYEKSGPNNEAGDLKWVNKAWKVTPIVRQKYNFNKFTSEVRFGPTTIGNQELVRGQTGE